MGPALARLSPTRGQVEMPICSAGGSAGRGGRPISGRAPGVKPTPSRREGACAPPPTPIRERDRRRAPGRSREGRGGGFRPIQQHRVFHVKHANYAKAALAAFAELPRFAPKTREPGNQVYWREWRKSREGGQGATCEYPSLRDPPGQRPTCGADAASRPHHRIIGLGVSLGLEV